MQISLLTCTSGIGGDGGGWRRRFSPVDVNVDVVLSVCTVSFFLSVLLRGGGDVDNHPLRTFTAASKQSCLCLDGGIIAPPALRDPRRARPSRSKQFSGRREARGCLIWRWYREMFHPAKATSDTMWQHRTWSPSKQWKLLFIYFLHQS